MSQGYSLPASEAEVARLRMQSDLFRDDAESMLDRIGVRPGWRCLDLCCGVGGITDLLSRRAGPDGEAIGLDRDAWKLEVARELDQMLADLRRHLSEPETLMISYAMIQVTGRTPGP